LSRASTCEGYRGLKEASPCQPQAWLRVDFTDPPSRPGTTAIGANRTTGIDGFVARTIARFCWRVRWRLTISFARPPVRACGHPALCPIHA